MKYFIHFLALSFDSIFNFSLTEAAQYECSYRRTAHHATGFTTAAIRSTVAELDFQSSPVASPSEIKMLCLSID